MAFPELHNAPWEIWESEIRAVRHAVFTVEQGVDAALDVDGEDPRCCHVLAWMGGEAVATGRVQPDGHIGRVAVLKPWRGQGIGRSVMAFLVAEAKRQQVSCVYLNAQVTAVGFYEGIGFQKVGPVFVEAGIDHVRMEWGTPE